MMSRVTLAILLIAIFSCKNKKDIPSDVLKPEKMQLVLWDMIRADQLSQEILLHDSSRKVQPENLKLYSKVFQAHKISNEKFKTSFAFYQDRPDLLRVIFDSIHVKRTRELEDNEAKLKELPKVKY